MQRRSEGVADPAARSQQEYTLAFALLMGFVDKYLKILNLLSCELNCFPLSAAL